jgi:hypothetical protein
MYKFPEMYMLAVPAEHQKTFGFEILPAVLHSYYVNPLPLIIHCVDVILMHVAEPFVAKVREPAVPASDSVSVSLVIAIVTFATAILINVIAVPTE